MRDTAYLALWRELCRLQPDSSHLVFLLTPSQSPGRCQDSHRGPLPPVPVPLPSTEPTGDSVMASRTPHTFQDGLQDAQTVALRIRSLYAERLTAVFSFATLQGRHV